MSLKRPDRLFLLGIPLALLLASCVRTDPHEQTAQPSKVVIYQLQAGAAGNNNKEFIQLYNHGDDLIDLKGWSLVYRLPTGADDLIVMAWDHTALIPPYGHFLLVRDGQDFSITPDGYFKQALNAGGGGLGLINPEGELVDAVGWGNAPDRFIEGAAAPVLAEGHSLIRQMTEAPADVQDTDVNLNDFVLIPDPEPLNVTHTYSPESPHTLQLEVTAPDEVRPGADFVYTITLSNLGDSDIRSLIVRFPIPDTLEGIQLSADWERAGAYALWRVDQLAPDQVFTRRIEVQAPWVYGTLTLQNAHSTLEETGESTFAAVLRTEITGGAIPISIARTLIGQKVIVEGIATMYTGGFFAGSSGAKFYLDDSSGGVQIFVPNGMGVVDVPIGARVRVEGEAQLYRGALEIVPGSPEAVQVLEINGVSPAPMPVDIRQVANDMDVTPGLLVEVQGMLVRAEEFSYSYELDFVDERGQQISAYLDKETMATIEGLSVGEEYRAIGIMEIRDGHNLLNPRQASDISRIFQPIVYVDADAPSAVTSGDEFTVTISIENHTGQPLLGFSLRAEAPPAGFPILNIGEAGELGGGQIIWVLPELPADGGRAEVHYTLRMIPGASHFDLEAYSVDLPSGVESSPAPPLRVFNGGVVPIWAIQGTGAESPYRLAEVTTTGVITGVFPDLQGFWIQDPSMDDDPLTSQGLFIFTGEPEPDLQSGDSILVLGQVREISQQTQLFVSSSEEIIVTSRQNSLPAPIPLDPPAGRDASAAYYEALEGMLVALDQPAIVVGPTSRYGETFTVLSRHGITRVQHGEESGWMIIVDDGSAATHYDQSTMAFSAAVGDELVNAVGPLAYTFGAYKIEPMAPPEIRASQHPLPSLALVEQPDFSIMTWNVENLFDILEPHPTDPPRPRKSEYDLSLQKIAATIISAGAPTLVGLQEVENLGVLTDIADRDLLRAHAYIPILIEGTDSRGIDVGYLVRTDQAEILDYQQWPSPEGLTSRPPLMIHLKLRGRPDPIEFYVLNNHFTSLAGGEQATEPRRNEQALWNIEVMRKIRVGDPQAQFIVIGDLNSYPDSLPLYTLEDAGLIHVFEIDPTNLWYSYIYQGITQTLDHILVDESLYKLLVETIALHTNADFPLPAPGDGSPLHQSDHDPIIATFSP